MKTTDTAKSAVNYEVLKGLTSLVSASHRQAEQGGSFFKLLKMKNAGEIVSDTIKRVATMKRKTRGRRKTRKTRRNSKKIRKKGIKQFALIHYMIYLLCLSFSTNRLYQLNIDNFGKGKQLNLCFLLQNLSSPSIISDAICLTGIFLKE